MIKIDGSFGEGGGQVLRTSLALSMVTGQKLHIENIRAGRKKPGLLRQHLTAVQAAQQVCNADLKGNKLQSAELVFEPGKIEAGTYSFKIGTAGSTTLVLQTVLPALLTKGDNSTIELEGGTHNPYAPPFEFFNKTFAPLIMNDLLAIKAKLGQVGFYPAGGGKISVDIDPTSGLKEVSLVSRGELLNCSVTAFSSQIPGNIGEKEKTQAKFRLNLNDENCYAKMVRSVGPGNVLLIEANFENITELFSGFGHIGKPLKRVVDQAVNAYFSYMKAEVPVGHYLADQLLIPMALNGKGIIKTVKPSGHTLTNIEVIKRFLDIKIKLTEVENRQWIIEVGN